MDILLPKLPLDTTARISLFFSKLKPSFNDNQHTYFHNRYPAFCLATGLTKKKRDILGLTKFDTHQIWCFYVEKLQHETSTPDFQRRASTAYIDYLATLEV